MPISPNSPAGLQQPSTSATASSTPTQAAAGSTAPNVNLSGTQPDGGGSGGDVGSTPSSGGATTTTTATNTSPTTSLPLGSSNIYAPAAAGTGANIGTTGSASTQASLSSTAQTAIAGTLASVKSGNPSAIQASTQALLNASGGADDFSGMSVQMIIQKVLMEAYDGTQKDLKSIANRYQFFNSVKNNIRNEITRTRAALASAGSGASLSSAFPAHQTTTGLDPDGTTGKVSFSQSPQWTPFTPIDGSSSDPNAGSGGVGANGTITTKNALSAYASKLDSDLDTAGDNSSQMQTKLQAITSQQQQLLSIITQLIKQWSDTSMSIIHNI